MRQQLFVIQSKKIPFANEVSFESLANLTEGFSGAEIVHICQEAAYRALTRNCTLVSTEDLTSVLEHVKPRISSEEIEYFENFLNS